MKNSKLDVSPLGDSFSTILPLWAVPCQVLSLNGRKSEMHQGVEFHIPLVFLLYQHCIRVLVVTDIILIAKPFYVSHQTVMMEILSLVKWCSSSATCKVVSALLGAEMTCSWIKKTNICFSKIILNYSKLRKICPFVYWGTFTWISLCLCW